MNEEQLIASEFARILKQKDSEALAFKNYSPGVGSFDEIRLVNFFEENQSVEFRNTLALKREIKYPNSEERLDLIFTKNNDEVLLVEFKLCRPFRNNGSFDEHFYKTIFSPYDNNTLMTDILKLGSSSITGNKYIMFVYFEPSQHSNTLLSLNRIISKIISDSKFYYGTKLEESATAHFTDLIHPIHQSGAIVLLKIQS